MPAVKLLDLSHRQRLDRYELVGELASGGMATVFLGRIGGVGGFQRFVAIKRLHPHLAHEQEFVEMFVDEARLAASIHHPNVVPILDIGASEQGYYLVMEYVEGDTLARFLARAASQGERLPIPIALRIILDTLAGLHAAHELRDENDEPLGLVHRDVSPQNILVGVDGTSRITDFGVAHASSRLTTTRGGQLKGKLAYMAPEQARGQGVDRRADVFAMGTVLWEVLAGRRLFKADGDAETLNRVLFEPIPRLREVDASAPAALDAVAAKALERDVDLRYATCAELSDAIERAARATRLVASARDVASYVQQVIGQTVQQQREAVRAWLAASEPSRVSPGDLRTPPALFASGIPADPTRAGSSVSATAITIRHGESPRLTPPPIPVETGSSSRRVWVAASSAAGALLVGVGIWAFGSKTPASSSLPPAEVSVDAPASGSAFRVESAPTASGDLAIPSEEPQPSPSASADAPEPASSHLPVAESAPETDIVKPAVRAPSRDSTVLPTKKTINPKPARPLPLPSSNDDIISNPYR